MRIKLLFLSVVLSTTILGVTAGFSAELSETINGITWRYTVENGEAAIAGASIEGSEVCIPSCLGGNPVTSISEWALYSKLQVERLIIPSSIVSIENEAFGWCYITNLCFLGACPSGCNNYQSWLFACAQNVYYPAIFKETYLECPSEKFAGYIDVMERESKVVSVDAKAAEGSFICSANSGDIIKVQYVDGVWSCGTSLDNSLMESPDTLEIASDEKRASIVLASNPTVILAKIPYGTESRPFYYVVQESGNYALRMNDNDFNDNTGCVRYKVSAGDLALDAPDTPVFSPASRTLFDENLSIAISCDTEGTTIYYTTDGTDPTVNSPIYKRFRIYDKTMIKAIAVKNGMISEIAVAEYAKWECATPIISVNSSFSGSKTKVAISCKTEGAIIYYTLDGRMPTTNSTKYSGPFYVKDSSTIKAYAVKPDCLDSLVSSVDVEKVWTIGDTMGKPDHKFFTEGSDDCGWFNVYDESAPNGVAMRAGSISHNQTSVLRTSVMGPGRLTFSWRTSCEADVDGLYAWDHAEFLVDGEIRLQLDGVNSWRAENVEIEGDGEHSVEWRYVKDDVESEGEDAAWVSGYGWVSEYVETQTTEVAVPYAWLLRYDPEIVDEFDDFETAAGALSGKTQGGKATKIWEEFVAGTDPTNEASVLTAKIVMVDGAPVVTWEPNLNTNGVERLYKVHGKESLSSEEDWAYPTNSLHRFFKVTVEMP